MTASQLLKILSLSSALVVPACAVDPEAATDELTPIENTTAIHMLPVRGVADGPVLNSAPPGAHLSFFGGPVLKNVHNAPPVLELRRTVPVQPEPVLQRRT